MYDPGTSLSPCYRNSCIEIVAIIVTTQAIPKIKATIKHVRIYKHPYVLNSSVQLILGYFRSIEVGFGES